MSAYPTMNQEQADARHAQMLWDAVKVRRLLKIDGEDFPATQDRTILVVLCGLPGTGKTHFAKELTKHTPFCVFESDQIRKTLVSKPKYTRGEHARVFNVCHFLIEEYLGQGQRVLFDATNLTENFRLPLREISQRQNARLTMVHLTAPKEVVRQRLQERKAEQESDSQPGNYSDADWLIYSRLAPYDEPIEGDHLSVDTSEDISSTLEAVIKLAISLD